MPQLPVVGVGDEQLGHRVLPGPCRRREHLPPHQPHRRRGRRFEAERAVGRGVRARPGVDARAVELHLGARRSGAPAQEAPAHTRRRRDGPRHRPPAHAADVGRPPQVARERRVHQRRRARLHPPVLIRRIAEGRRHGPDAARVDVARRLDGEAQEPVGGDGQRRTRGCRSRGSSRTPRSRRGSRARPRRRSPAARARCRGTPARCSSQGRRRRGRSATCRRAGGWPGPKKSRRR